MFKQEVNLYATFKPVSIQTSPLNWPRLLLANAIFITLLLLMLAQGLWHNYHLTSKQKAAQQTANLLQIKFLQLRATYPIAFFATDAQQSIKNLQQEIERQQKVIDAIKNRIPFSSLFVLLSQVITSDVWLTSFTLGQGGYNIILQGKSLTKEALQASLEKLLQEKIFADYSVNINNIKRVAQKNAADIFQFEINIVKKT